MNQEKLRCLIALSLIDDVGPVTINNLMKAFESPGSVFSASQTELSAIPRLSPVIADGIKKFTDWRRVDQELEQAEKLNVSLIAPDDESYPGLLRHIYDYPPLLYVRGALEKTDINLAVVGSRRATPQGTYICDRITRELALRGVTIVSGMARGIDSAAHRSSLSARGRTIAVLGSGLDVIYPPENTNLYEMVCEKGAVISEYPFGSQPLGHHFPRRNRIISGMSYGVVVVEATEKSGSLITARMALDQGREVFAVPGSIESGASRGTNSLIKNGAKLVQNVDDIFNEIRFQIEPAREMEPHSESEEKGSGKCSLHGDLNEEHGAILKLIGTRPIHVDSLIDQLHMTVNRLLDGLLALEMRGRIRQLPGRYFIIKE